MFYFQLKLCFIFHSIAPIFNNFLKESLNKNGKTKTRDFFSKCGLNFEHAIWFNCLKPTIIFKTFTNIYKVKIIHLTFFSSCNKWVCKRKYKRKKYEFYKITNIFFNVRMLPSLMKKKNGT